MLEMELTGFGQTLGHRRVKRLHRFNEVPSLQQVINEVGDANIVYFCGGDTPKLVETMNQIGATDVLLKAFCSDTVAYAISAGMLAMCWMGQSDTKFYHLPPGSPPNAPCDYVDIEGWNLIPAYGAVHYNGFHPNGAPRSLYVRGRVSQMSRDSVALALTNQAAMVLDRGKVWVVTSDITGQLFKLSPNRDWPDGVLSQAIGPSDEGLLLSELLAVS